MANMCLSKEEFIIMNELENYKIIKENIKKFWILTKSLLHLQFVDFLG